MAVIDWYSRYVLGWALSTTLDADFCIEAVGKILEDRQCEVFNTDQGAQFTTPRFIQPLLDKRVKVSMDGRGRALDNIFVEHSGGRSSMSMFIYRKYRRSGKLGWDYGTSSTSITMNVSINHWTTAHLLKCIWRGRKDGVEGSKLYQPSSILIS
ncbi:MAG: Integrase catalytic region [Halothiobacillaceae bacterium]|nr:MAG: Integrase catalytic region [Halothiobacillaceae bacterium]